MRLALAPIGGDKPVMAGGRKIIIAAVCAIVLATPARAADAPFEPQLLRLAEILGSLHFLRNLCGEESDEWRGRMEQLIAAEEPDEARRARFVARFNRGYQAFETSYATCTDAAVEAISRYMSEGERIARDVALRYGN
jgi:uncharacterized protein (TIGR02301 family)